MSEYITTSLFHYFFISLTASGIPYNVSIFAINLAGEGQLNSTVFFTSELSMFVNIEGPQLEL